VIITAIAIVVLGALLRVTGLPVVAAWALAFVNGVLLAFLVRTVCREAEKPLPLDRVCALCGQQLPPGQSSHAASEQCAECGSDLRRPGAVAMADASRRFLTPSHLRRVLGGRDGTRMQAGPVTASGHREGAPPY
jgi:hypothetical protein